MDWIIDHIQILIAVAGAIAYWLNARKKEKAGEPADYDGDGQPDNHPPRGQTRELHDPRAGHGSDENTRRIQDEIRRKIAERRGELERAERPMAPPLPTPARPVPPAMPSPVTRRREQELAPHAREARREEEQRASAVILARQRALAEQLAALDARKAEAGRDARAVWSQVPSEPAGPGEGAVGRGWSSAQSGLGARDDHGLLAELRNAHSLRRAIILREVLDTPVGLR